jgi:predicted O-methyltransferase YrrM
MSTFSSDWMSANLPDWYRVRDMLRPRSYLEVGSFEGRSACEIINTFDSVEEVTCIDAWEPYGELGHVVDMKGVEQRFHDNVQEAVRFRAAKGMPMNVERLKGRSFDALTHLITVRNKAEHFDLVYIDGSHKPEDALMDMMLTIRLVKVGGVMIVDDYLWDVDREGNDLLDTPRIAIDAFGLVMRRYVMDIPRMSLYQRFFQKTKRVS